MEYRPEFPDRFGCITDARAFYGPYFDWYNGEHRHSGIAMLTPADVHFGRSSSVMAARQSVLHAAYEAHPERFTKGLPVIREAPREVWINKPSVAIEGVGVRLAGTEEVLQ